MKNPRHYLLCCLLMLLGAASLKAQSQGFAYQAVARDLNGNLLANQNVNVRMVLRSASAAGNILYEETHAATTNDFGLMTLVIGGGTSVSGNFGSIDWSPADIFLDVQINGVSVSNEQLLLVPYAKMATDMSLKDLVDVGSLSPGNNEVLKFNGTEWVAAADAVNDADASPTNEIQTL
ncbi:MAG: hypothetical protein NWR72_16305, partial [Bacteroidia bacterium]|nr:hypothetical protein [Bacteroidia bacterium]